jgi:acyl-CoA reductase-like NAD-dependent aldehyde dehydrogenase
VTVLEQTRTPAPTGSEIAVHHPATGEEIARVPNMGAEQVAELVARARAAQPVWEALGFRGRERVLLRCQQYVLDHADTLSASLMRETGKTL